MGIGSTISNGALALAQDISLALFGVIALVTVITGFLILTGIGGQGIQKFVRQYIVSMIFALIFTGGFNRIASGAQNMFR